MDEREDIMIPTEIVISSAGATRNGTDDACEAQLCGGSTQELGSSGDEGRDTRAEQSENRVLQDDSSPLCQLSCSCLSREGGGAKYCHAALAFLVLVGLVGMTVVILIQKGESPSSASEQEPVPVQSTTWDLETRLYEIKSALSISVPDPTKFFEHGTPQARALNWLVYEDTFLTSAEEAHLLQRYALMVFAYATNVELWRTTTPWHELGDVHECSFPGVDCDEHKKVTSIELIMFKLSGGLPDDIGLLTDLTSLNLERNSLAGSIPETLYTGLTKLGTLSMVTISIQKLLSRASFRTPHSLVEFLHPRTH
jgi:hypothetical protein